MTDRDNGYTRTLLLMCLTVIIIQAMVAGINLAIPALAASDLRPTHTQLVWIVDTYVLVFAGLLIPAGALGDRIGRRSAVVLGLVLFALACLLSGLAPNVATLQVGRALGGVAAAVAQPATLSICLTTAPARRRAQAVATWTAALGVGGIVGNLAAGAILAHYDWPAYFLAFVPAAALLAVLTAALVPAVPRHPAHADPLGTLLLVAGLFAVLFGIIEGPEHGWAAVEVLGGFAAGAVLLGAFVWHGLVARHPLVDPRVFAHPGVRAGALGVGAGFLALFGLFFANAQFLQDVKGYSTLRTGIAIAPLAAGMMVVSARGAALAGRFGARLVVGTGLGCIAGGLLLMSTADRGTPYPVYVVYLLLMASGMGLSAPSLTAAVLGGLPHERAGLGSGINSAAREIGAALGVAIVGTVLNAHNALGSPAAFVAGMAVGYRILAVVLLLVGLAVVLMWRHSPHPPSAPAAAPAGANLPEAESGTPLTGSVRVAE